LRRLTLKGYIWYGRCKLLQIGRITTDAHRDVRRRVRLLVGARDSLRVLICHIDTVSESDDERVLFERVADLAGIGLAGTGLPASVTDVMATDGFTLEPAYRKQFAQWAERPAATWPEPPGGGMPLRQLIYGGFGNLGDRLDTQDHAAVCGAWWTRCRARTRPPCTGH
jgi:hypothetical protein